MAGVLKPPECKLDGLMSGIECWEKEVREFEKRRNPDGDPIPLEDDIKSGVLQEMCPAQLRDHLMLNGQRLKGYTDIREEIVSFLEARNARSLDKHRHHKKDKDGDDPMGLHTFKKGGGSKGNPHQHKGPCWTCGGPLPAKQTE